MSATLTATTGSDAVPAKRPDYKVTFGRVVRSEWAKFLSLRSTWITLAVAGLLLVGIGIMGAYRYDPTAMRGPSADAHDAVTIALRSTELAQLALGVLGVLATAGEYTTGLIRSTLAAVPKRLPVLAAKVLVYFGVVIVVATAGAFLSFLGGEPFLHGKAIALTLSSSGVLRCLFGAGLYLALIAVLGAALGMLVRSVAGGISLLVVLLMLLPVFLDILPSSWKPDVSPYLPGLEGGAGGSIIALHQESGTLSPGAGLAVLCAWVVVALAGAAYRLLRSDS
ncbi:ABC transporter permease [Streptacidiphilus anmyonensis]|uniref:ABC transporter permease n=1 Tax=Streptacidiphilus anmyonensis TaxID=405782 RepID=UPI0005AAAE87|nr:ABC transporter permease [Streptacidiphilus anmyonensis]